MCRLKKVCPWRAAGALFILVLILGPASAAEKLVLPLAQTGPMTLNFLQTGPFDPVQGQPAIPEHLRAPAPAGRDGIYVLQFAGPVREDWKRAVTRLGAGLIVPVANYGFVARLDPDRFAAIAALPEVRWIGRFEPVWKILPCALQEPGTRTYVAWLFPDEDGAATVARLAELGARAIATDFNPVNRSIRFELDGTRLIDVARIPAVHWIENWAEMTPDNADVQWVDQKGYFGVADTSRPIWRRGIIGDSMIVGLTDTPMWMGHNFYRDLVVPSPGPTHRKVIAYTGPTGSDAHGTHTAGTICGDDSAVGGTLLHDGLARHARLYFQNYAQFASWDMNTWLIGPYTGVSGLVARTHSMSLSRKDTFNYYVGTDRSLDQFIWNGHRDLLHCNSMGNYGVNQMGHPVASKNIIATGGTQNGTACNSFYTTSSRGPTNDGRRRPVLISPAQNVVSASNTVANGTATLSGTSMATPNMTAGMTLIRQYFVEGWYPTGTRTPANRINPSAALLKATGIAGADNSITGYTVPDNNVGWGRIDLDSSLYFAGDARKLWLKDDTLGLATGDSVIYSVQIGGTAQPFRVALVWSDFPGTPYSYPILINNLDLTVISPSGTEYRGSVYAGGQSVTGGNYDTLNNEEAFRLNSPATGSWRIKVRARNVPQGPQPFALAATGDIVTGSLHDVGVRHLVAPLGVLDSAVFVPACTVFNYGTFTESYNVRMRIGAGYNQVVPATAQAPGTATALFFPAVTLPRGGPLVVSCSTELAADQNPVNDRQTGTLTVVVRDVACRVLLSPAAGTRDSGAVTLPACSLYNHGSQSVSYQVRLRIGTRYQEVVGVTGHAPLTARHLEFPVWTALERGGLVATCSTEYADDRYPGNDCRRASLFVRVADLALQSLNGLPAAVDSGTALTPQATVRNLGNEAATFSLCLAVDDGYAQTLNRSLPPGVESTYAFPVWTARLRGLRSVRCSTRLAGDMVPANDLRTATVDVRIRDAEAVGIVAPAGTLDSGTVVTPQASVRNNGTAAATFDVRFDIGAWTDTRTVNLAAGATELVSFAAWTATQRGSYVVRCTTMLGGDLVASNNLQTAAVSVAVSDAEVVSIAGPSGAVDSGTVVTPQALVRNNGTAAATFDVRFDIGAWTDTRTVNLAAGATELVGFGPWTATQRGSFAVRCTTRLVNDMVPANDLQTTSVDVAVRDIAAVAILAPVGVIITGDVTPRAMVRNRGTARAACSVSFEINSAPRYLQTLNLIQGLPGNDTTLEFPEWPGTPGDFHARCSTWLADDQVPANDVVSLDFRVVSPESGWIRKVDLPAGGRDKKVKDGGALAYAGDEEPGCVYAFKGNNRPEFYEYSIAANTWTTRESIPAIGSTGRKKLVKKGASLVVHAGMVYGAKGNNSLEYWRFDPQAGGAYPWQQLPDVPTGSRNVREGSGQAAAGEYVYLLKGSGTTEFYRYRPADRIWETMAGAPSGASGRAFKNGSCIAFDGAATIYALKASYNEFYAYRVDSNRWTTLAALPFTGSAGRKRVKDGAGLAFQGGLIYALKGGNTFEYWSFDPAVGNWSEKENVPLGGGRKVKGGGALTASERALYAFKGNSTLEFYKYAPAAAVDWSRSRIAGGNALDRPIAGLPDRILGVAPNPFSGSATITFCLPRAGPVSLRLYGISGRLVGTLAEGLQPAGLSTLYLERSALGHGVYIIRLEARDPGLGFSVLTRKLIVE